VILGKLRSPDAGTQAVAGACELPLTSQIVTRVAMLRRSASTLFAVVLSPSPAWAATVVDDFASGTATSITTMESPALESQAGTMVGGKGDVTGVAATLDLNDSVASGRALTTGAGGPTTALLLRWGEVPSPASPAMNLHFSGDAAFRLVFGPETTGPVQVDLGAVTSGTGFSGITRVVDAGAGAGRGLASGHRPA
jgi:hypothetical protein